MKRLLVSGVVIRFGVFTIAVTFRSGERTLPEQPSRVG